MISSTAQYTRRSLFAVVGNGDPTIAQEECGHLGLAVPVMDPKAAQYGCAIRWHNGNVPMFQSIRDIFQPHASSSARPLAMPERLEAPQGFPRISLRPITEDDAEDWNDVRWANRDWLLPWESGNPVGGGKPLSFNAWVRRMRDDEASGTGAVFLIEYQMQLVGQVSIGAISYGAVRSGMVGYWVSQRYAGRGFAPLAVAMLADWAFYDPSGPGLHRIEIAILPENFRSKRVAAKLGLQPEGLKRQYMYVNGRWRDHETFSLLASDQSVSVTERLRRPAESSEGAGR